MSAAGAGSFAFTKVTAETMVQEWLQPQYSKQCAFSSKTGCQQSKSGQQNPALLPAQGEGQDLCAPFRSAVRPAGPTSGKHLSEKTSCVVLLCWTAWTGTSSCSLLLQLVGRVQRYPQQEISLKWEVLGSSESATAEQRVNAQSLQHTAPQPSSQRGLETPKSWCLRAHFY